MAPINLKAKELWWLFVDNKKYKIHHRQLIDENTFKPMLLIKTYRGVI